MKYNNSESFNNLINNINGLKEEMSQNLPAETHPGLHEFIDGLSIPILETTKAYVCYAVNEARKRLIDVVDDMTRFGLSQTMECRTLNSFLDAINEYWYENEFQYFGA